MEGPFTSAEAVPSSSLNLRILMFPWLAYGHLNPFLELAKKLVDKGFYIYLCSTPINLSFISKKITEKYSPSIELVEFKLQNLAELPPQHQTTNGLPPHLMSIFQKAILMSKPNYSKVIETLKPDLVIYDALQPWVRSVISLHNIPAVSFMTSGAMVFSFFCHRAIRPGLEYPFPTIYLRDFEKTSILGVAETLEGDKEENPFADCPVAMLIKTSREIEEKYIHYLADMFKTKVVPVGLLVQDFAREDEDLELIDWLGEKKDYSTVFVSFGSEFFPTNEEIKEIALGLELSSVNFIWVLRFPKGETIGIEEVLPEGFLGRVKGRGRIVKGWAPQAKILGHSSVGGFVSHCGWNSIFESIEFGVPIIAMPMIHDQPLNARLAVEIGVAVEVMRNSNGRLKREEIGKVIKELVIGNAGETLRSKMKCLSLKIKQGENEELDRAVGMLVQLCG